MLRAHWIGQGRCQTRWLQIRGSLIAIGWTLIVWSPTEYGIAQTVTVPDADVESLPSEALAADELSARRKSAAAQLLNEAKRAAIRGDEARARSLASRAAEIPTTWDTSELTPERFLRELNRRDGIFADTELPRVSNRVAGFANDQPDQTRSAETATIPDGQPTASGGIDGSATIQAFRRVPSHVLDSVEDLEAPVNESRTESALENRGSPASDFVDQAGVSNETQADPPALDIPGQASFSAAPVMDVRVHDFSSATGDSNGHASLSSQILVSLASILAAGLIGALVLLGICLILLRKLGSRGNIVFKIELNSGKPQVDDGPTDSSQVLRLAQISTRDPEGDRALDAPQDDSLSRAGFGDSLDVHGPRNPGGGAAA